jgi:hypothetical protein
MIISTSCAVPLYLVDVSTDAKIPKISDLDVPEEVAYNDLTRAAGQRC